MRLTTQSYPNEQTSELTYLQLGLMVMNHRAVLFSDINPCGNVDCREFINSMTIDQLFFELIQVAIGNKVCLSHSPTAAEWKALYDMAKKQSLVGICFAGVQRLNSLNPSMLSQLPEANYLRWMAIAAKIQQKNEKVNRQCVELQAKLSADGFRSCILKGQGVAQLYVSLHSQPSSLSLLRQSGDIDVWVLNKSIEELVEYVKNLGVSYKATVAHVECKLFDGTEVEFHSMPAFMRNFRTNRKLVQWVNDSSLCSGGKAGATGSIVECELGFYVPTVEFNLVYMMAHMYHHVLFEGLGLRQVMDYYFVLRQFQKVSDGFCVPGRDNLAKAEKTVSPKSIKNIVDQIEKLGMRRFATGIMWIMKEVFIKDSHSDNFFLGIKPDEKYGRLILEDVMSGGNFGHHDEKNKGLHSDSAIGRSLNGLKRNMKFFALGPWEILSSPMWSAWHRWWRKRHGII